MNQTLKDRHNVGQTPRNAFSIGIVAAVSPQLGRVGRV